MFEPSVLISPLSGAAIGYFTNWLAIKMLFRPYTEKKFFGVKVPFTPGLIAKEKPRMAKTLGSTVGEYLLTEDAVIRSLESPEAMENMEEMLDNAFTWLQNMHLTVDDCLLRILREDKENAVDAAEKAAAGAIKAAMANQEFVKNLSDTIFVFVKTELDKPISKKDKEKYFTAITDIIIIKSKDIAESGFLRKTIEEELWNFILGGKTDERTLESIISESSAANIKDYLSIKMPQAIHWCLEVSEDPEIEFKLKDGLQKIIVKFAGSFMGMIISVDSVYGSIKESIEKYANDPENQNTFDEVSGVIIDKVLQTTVGTVAETVSGQLREYSINKGVSIVVENMLREENIEQIVKKLLSSFYEDENDTLGDMIKKIEPEAYLKLNEIIFTMVESFCENGASELIYGFVSQCKESILPMKISELAETIDDDFYNRAKAALILTGRSLAIKAVPVILSTVNVPKVVEEQINTFDMKYTEELILAIASKELKSITIVGGVLGFIIGWIPVLLNI